MKFAISILLTVISTVILIGEEKDSVPPVPTPTKANVAYGPHPENVLDFWKAEGDGPRPLHVYIHGGGWRAGSKKVAPGYLDRYLEAGVSCASVEYRLTPDNPLPAPVHDAARAIQFIRTKAAEWNIDPEQIVLTGGSAGACTSMWLLMHDDLADPESEDPVLRESTRVSAGAVWAGQTSIDPKQIVPWIGPNGIEHPMIANAVGEKSIETALENYDQHQALYREFSSFNHVSEGDPPLYMRYKVDMELPSRDAGHGIHHPVFGVKMKEKCDELGVDCHLLVPGTDYQSEFKTEAEFLLDFLGVANGD